MATSRWLRRSRSSEAQLMTSSNLSIATSGLDHLNLSSIEPGASKNCGRVTVHGNDLDVGQKASETLERRAEPSTSQMPSSPLFAHSTPHDVLADTPYLNLPIMTMRTTALQVCYSVYGESPMSLDVVDRCYENNAGNYENPFVTATSKEVISDIHRLARQLGTIDVPRPLALIFALFGLQPPKADVDTPLFQALRVWNDIGDICDCEMFDGHRKTIVEHTLNILLLPGLHHDGFHRHPSDDATESLATATDSLGLRLPPIPRFALPSLPVPGTSLSVPSPLHFKIHILTSLSFNEQGYVTRHCDYWDLKDLMGLVPGVSLAQWIMSRLTATGLSYAARLLQRPKMSSYATHVSDPSSLRLGAIHPNALGLEGIS